MPASVPASAIIEKNRITSNDTWLVLVEFRYKTEDPIYLCLNNAPVDWSSVTWEPACFSVDDDTETRDGDIPTVPFSFIDPSRKITPIIDKYGGCNGADVWIRIVHSGNLAEPVAYRTRYWRVMGSSVNHFNQVTFKLGVPNLTLKRDPQDRYFKNHGRTSVKFKDSTCGYVGSEIDCDKTLLRCRQLGNSRRYCGFPGVGQTGFLA